MRLFHCIISPYILLLAITSQAQPILLEGNLERWTHTSIVGDTIYEPIMDIDQGVIIRAESHQSASGLNYSHTINLDKTPILQWQWTAQTLPYALKVNEEGLEQRMINKHETQVQGNDFVLRVIVSRSPLFSDEQSLHYVWSANQAINSHWALDENNKVMVVSGEGQTTMKWQTLSRHVQKDWFEMFGEHIDSIDDITLMTDSDAIQGHAVGYYGDMRTLEGKPLASIQ